MGDQFHDFASLIPFFYNDQNRYSKLSFIFQKNVNMFEKSFDIVNRLPSYLELQRFIFISCMSKMHLKALEFKLLFNVFKESLLCLISMYEIVNGKSFENFVKILPYLPYFNN